MSDERGEGVMHGSIKKSGEYSKNIERSIENSLEY